MWICSWLSEISSSRSSSSILIDQEQCLVFNINVWNTLFQHTNIIHIPWSLGSKREMFIHKKTMDNGGLEIRCVFHLSLELTRDSWTNTFKMVQPPKNEYLDSNHMVNTDSCFSFSTHYDNESPLVFLFIIIFI